MPLVLSRDSLFDFIQLTEEGWWFEGHCRATVEIRLLLTSMVTVLFLMVSLLLVSLLCIPGREHNSMVV